MTEPRKEPARRGGVSPFVAFGVVAVLAGVGAVWEISYWVGVSALSSTVLGTTVGIVAALFAFFAWGLYAPPNE